MFAGLVGERSNPVIRELVRTQTRDVVLHNSIVYYQYLGVNFDVESGDTKYYLDMLVASILAILLRWFSSRRADKPEKIAGLIKSCLLFFMNLMSEQQVGSDSLDDK